MRKQLLLIPLIFMLFSYRIENILAAAPASDNYQLQDYGFGAGGTEGSTSDNYGVFGILGQTDGAQGTSDNFKLGPGLAYGVTANTPAAPTFTNPNNYYNKLHIVLDDGGNATETLFAIAISTDNFASDTQYIQDDNTIGSTLGSEDWQDYTTWGESSGFDVIGLEPGTTYTIKVTAKQGGYTQSPYSETTQAATVNPTLSFDIDVSSSNSESSAPYAVDFGSLTAGVVSTADEKIWLDLDTNASSGAYVYLYDQYGGLRSSTTAYTISSLTGNLASTNEGFGLRSESVAESSGGPLQALTPYDGTADNVGIVNTTIQEIYNTNNNPINGGRASMLLKAKTSNTTPASNDYADNITIIASGTF